MSYLRIVLIVIFSLLTIFPVAAQEATPDPSAAVEYRIEQVVVANFPVGLVAAPDGRIFYTERTTGNIRAINADGTSQINPVIHLDTDVLVERGLYSLALDPNYADNGMIWTVHTRPGTATDFPTNQVVRFHEENGVGSNPEVMLSVPITNGELKHNGGGINFDADGRLYVSLGEYGDPSFAQDLSVYPGKIHRFDVTDEGLQPAEGNPFEDSSIYAYGLRNTFDFTIDPLTGAIFGSENGFHCDDEINRIEPGKNYGWGPDYGTKCFGTDALDLPDYMPPMLSYNPTIAPTGITVYRGEMFPAWDGNIFFCAFNTGALTRVTLDETQTAVISSTPMNLGENLCRTDVTVGNNGELYFADFGGIYRIVAD